MLSWSFAIFSWYFGRHRVLRSPQGVTARDNKLVVFWISVDDGYCQPTHFHILPVLGYILVWPLHVSLSMLTSCAKAVRVHPKNLGFRPRLRGLLGVFRVDFGPPLGSGQLFFRLCVVFSAGPSSRSCSCRPPDLCRIFGILFL